MQTALEVIVVVLLAVAALAAPPSIDKPLRSGVSAPNDAAVVVGIESYPFLPDVSHAYRDAEVVHSALVYTVGIPPDRVALLKGGNREQISAAVRRAADSVGEGGTLWVYFAGHGAADASGAPILVGDDARRDPEVFGARSVTLAELTASVSGPVNVLIDACWAGRSRDGEELMPGVRFAVPVWAGIGAEDPSRVRVWTAASPDQVSGPYSPAEHGLFTYFMVGALRGWADGELDGAPDGVVTAAEATRFVDRMFGVVQARSQQPMWQGARDVSLVASGRLES